MRRYFVLSVLGVCLLVFASGASAVAGGTSYYPGKNAQGLKLFFSVDHTATGPKFDPFFINQVSRCPATGGVIRVEFSFEGFQIPMKNGKFNLVLNDLGDRFGWSGTVTSKGASGKEHIDFAAFDSKGGSRTVALVRFHGRPRLLFRPRRPSPRAPLTWSRPLRHLAAR